MIFSRFFTPDHAKPDPKIRKAAAVQLSPDDPKSRQILHELAFNDEAPEVNLAALEQLNSFALWQKTAQTSKNERVKKAAKQKVRAYVLAGTEITENEKRDFLIESADADLSMEVLLSDGGKQFESEFVLSLLEKIDKPQFNETYFLQRASGEVRSVLLAQESNMSTLQKWLKKADSSVAEAIELRLATLEAERQRPAEVAKQTTMVLSKLQALLDENEFEAFEAKRTGLTEEYASLSAEFTCLKERDAEAFTDKYQRIEQRLIRYQETLSAAYKASEQERLKDETTRQLEDAIVQISRDLESMLISIDTVSLESLEVIQQRVQSIEHSIQSSTDLLGQEKAEPMQQRLSSLAVQLTKLPQWQKHTLAMTALLDELEKATQAENDDTTVISQKIEDFQTRFYDLYDPDSPIAGSHHARWKKLKGTLVKTKRSIEKENQVLASQLRKHLGVIISMIAQGKYRIAIIKFEKVRKQWEELNESVKRLLDRKYQEVLTEVEKLEGWQDYLSTPRKPMLLDQAKALVNNTSLTMPERANEIKLLRKSWQSLTLPNNDKEQDDSLSKEFDAVLEQAFSPCREFFAEQEKLREKSVAVRKALIQEMAELLQQVTDDNTQEIYSRYETLLKRWRSAEKLRPQDYLPLKQEFDALKARLGSEFDTWFEHNAEQKQRLVQRAQDLVTSEDVKQATESAKALQKEWRELATAGKRADGALWKKFRKANDAIFERLSDERKAFKKTVAEKSDALFAEVDNIKAEIESGNLKQAAEKLSALFAQARELPKSVATSLHSQIGELETKIAQVRVKEQVKQNQGKINALLNVLQDTAGMSDVQIQQHKDWALLESAWQQSLSAKNNTTSEMPVKSRAEALLLLEIALELPSPEEEQAKRQALQLSMLASSLGLGNKPDAHQYLSDWLSFGALDSVNESELVRLNNCLQALLKAV